MSGPPTYLLEWAAQPGPRLLLNAARARLERGKLGSRSVLNIPFTPSQRRDVGWLMPAGWTSSDEPVRTKCLRDGLADHQTGLEELLVATGGPLRDLVGEARLKRATIHQERSQAAVTLRTLLGAPVPAELESAVDDVMRRVLRGAEASCQARDVERVVKAIDAGDEAGLAVLAANLFKDAHALDRSRPLGRAVARLLALRAALSSAITNPDGDAGLAWSDPLASAEAWRAAWASGSVTCDAVSSQVLVLNLPLVGDAPAVSWCMATPGEPVWLTLRSLSGTFALPAPLDVFVCENPSIVEAAADQLGDACPPIVCSFGRPSSAFWTLLRGLGSARLHVRADADTIGWGIVRSLVDRLPNAVPWRMSEGSVEYEEEVLQDLLADMLSASGSRS